MKTELIERGSRCVARQSLGWVRNLNSDAKQFNGDDPSKSYSEEFALLPFVAVRCWGNFIRLEGVRTTFPHRFSGAGHHGLGVPCAQTAGPKGCQQGGPAVAVAPARVAGR